MSKSESESELESKPQPWFMEWLGELVGLVVLYGLIGLAMVLFYLFMVAVCSL
jgi:hypothetical protein